MAKVQKQFIEFDDKIRLGTIEGEANLRERREQVLTALKDGLAEIYADKDEKAPNFKKFDQGSYSLKTGIVPVDNKHDYDIDVGAVFDIDHESDEYKDDPVKIKRLIRDALEKKLEEGTVEIKSPCVTVTFDDGCHVDLAAYADVEMRIDVKLPLARGKEFAQNPEWETNYPSELARRIKSAFPNKDERKQFRRVLRALKRWRDLKYRSATSHASPVGVGLTVAGLTMFKPQGQELYDNTDDRAALEKFVRNLLNNFQENQQGDKDDEPGRRLVVTLPFAPHKDVFARMTNNNMGVLEDKLQKLLDDLVEAGEADKNTEACKCLKRQFGKDFPDGEDEEDDSTKNSVRKSLAILSPSISG